MMNADKLISALENHMDSLETYLASALVIAVITYWSGMVQKGDIEILGIKVQRQYASFVTGVAFLFFNLAILFSLMRVGALLAIVPDDRFEEAVTAVATHQWLLNPFSYFGADYSARAITGWGFGALIVVWWLCNTSFTLLQDLDRFANDTRYKFLISAVAGVFLVVGLLSMGAINSTYFTILTRGKQLLSADLFSSISTTAFERTISTFIGIGVGALIFMVSLAFKRGLSKTERSTKSRQKPNAAPIPTSVAEKYARGRTFKMRGLPLHLSGWNGEYFQTTQEKNGRGVWARSEHWYLGFLPLRIIGVTIWFDGKTWILHRDCDSEELVMARSEHQNPTPEGGWDRKAVLVGIPE